ncbi:hypothetical protein BGZ46_003303 [Entomortierella lignicola]|nr:hypothetical protein BGZ46_003303 [Entomortierella lignicola]
MQFRTGMKLIQQAYEDKYQALVEEVNTWKWISEEQSVQMTAMATELSRVEESYAALQKEAIVSMVDQHSGVSLTQLEQSILETIEADAENGDAGYGAVADADTSSFMLDDDDAESSSAQLPHQSRFVREDNASREQRISNVSASVSTSLKNSPQSISSRPRAFTEISAKRPGSTQNPNQSAAGYSPSRQGSSSARNSSAALSDNSSNGLKKMQKSESTDSLRSKRNTISSSSRPIYPNSLLSTGTGKRHSSVSPQSPRTKAVLPTSRTTANSSSFTTNSTPSTSPRQPTGSLVTSSIAGSITARNSRQQLQKEYSLHVRNSMSQLAGLSGVSSLSSTSPGDRTTSAIQSKSGSSGVSQVARRSQRSGSDSLSASGISPAALKLIRQQEQQQELEEETEYKQKGSSGVRHVPHHQTDDEDYRRSANQEHARSNHRKASESGHESVSRSHVIGYESSSKYESHYQNSSHGDKHESHPTGTTDTNNAKHSNGGVDASAFTMLYKEIRDSMDASSFGMFARVVTAFNEGDKTTEETLEEVGKIVKDRALNQRFRDLIHQAIAEKESQLENEPGNRTMEGDLTLEIDQSLLLDDDQDLKEDIQLLQKEEEHDGGTMQGDESLLQDQVDEVYPDESLLEETEQASLVLDATSRNIMSDDEIDANDENDENEPDMATQKSTRKQSM